MYAGRPSLGWLKGAALLALALLLPGCSHSDNQAPLPARPDLQYEPPALVEVMQEPLLAVLLAPEVMRCEPAWFTWARPLPGKKKAAPRSAAFKHPQGTSNPCVGGVLLSLLLAKTPTSNLPG